MAEKFYATHHFHYDVETSISSVPDEVSDCEMVDDPSDSEDAPVAGSSSEVLHSQTTQPACFLRQLQAPAQQSLTVPPSKLIPVLGLIVEGREEHDYSALFRGPDRISPGDGVEEEAVSTMFNRSCLVEPNKSRFFKTLYSDHDSITFFLPMRSSGNISVDCLQDMQDFGAVTALMLLYGKYPGLFSPIFLQFCIRALDIHSLTETFVHDWCPSLWVQIHNLIDVGHEGDLAQFNSIFQSYCDSSAHAYHPRTERAHDLLDSSVLYQCVIEREPPLYAKLQAFMKGFSLKTRNGFEFPSTLVNAYPGGSEGFLSLMNLSQITGYHSISQHTVFSSPGVTFESQMNNVLDLDPVFKFQDFMIDFLQGSGTPLQAHWEHSVQAGNRGNILHESPPSSRKYRPFLAKELKCGAADRLRCAGASDIPDGKGYLQAQTQVAVSYRQCYPFVPAVENEKVSKEPSVREPGKQEVILIHGGEAHVNLKFRSN
ncbi:hypothetical protein C8J56DRAFT_903385 [Mycena floridula]|nr:hypothetical protein C8J56DRAFT_903385 [Mycena floridula]